MPEQALGLQNFQVIRRESVIPGEIELHHNCLSKRPDWHRRQIRIAVVVNPHRKTLKASDRDRRNGISAQRHRQIHRMPDAAVIESGDEGILAANAG